MTNKYEFPQDLQPKKSLPEEEAGMLKAKLEINPHSGKIPTTKFERLMKDSGYSTEGREPTAEDYDAAASALNELRELAAKVPATEQVINALGRFSAETVSVLVGIFGDAIAEGAEYPGDKKPSLLDKIEDWKKGFEDEAYQLRKLKGEARKYGDKSQ